MTKPGLPARKVQLSVRLYRKGAIDPKRPEWVNRRFVVFRQDNASPHMLNRQKLRELGRKVHMHAILGGVIKAS